MASLKKRIELLTSRRADLEWEAFAREGLESYRDSKLGFEIRYPKIFSVSKGADAERAGTDRSWTLRSVSSKPDQGLMIGLSYKKKQPLGPSSVQLRVGATERKVEKEICELASPDRSEVINGVPFEVFWIGDGGMGTSYSGESFSTFHGGRCFAVERIISGRSYSEDWQTVAEYDSIVAVYYSLAKKVLQTFKFLEPN